MKSFSQTIISKSPLTPQMCPKKNELYQTAVPVPETEFSVQIIDKLGDALVKNSKKISASSLAL